MRKLILLFVLGLCLTSSAQTKYSVGTMFTGAGSISLKKDVGMVISVAPSFNVVMEKSNHHVMLGVVNAEIFEVDLYLQTLHALPIGRDWEVYGFFQTPLKKGNSYMSVGIEKVFSTPQRSSIITLVIPFLEFGTDFKKNYFVSLGTTIHPFLIFSRK